MIDFVRGNGFSESHSTQRVSIEDSAATAFILGPWQSEVDVPADETTLQEALKALGGDGIKSDWKALDQGIIGTPVFDRIQSLLRGVVLSTLRDGRSAVIVNHDALESAQQNIKSQERHSR